MFLENFTLLASQESVVLGEVRSSKTVAVTLRTNKYTFRQRGETGETRGKPKYIASVRAGQYTVQVCEIVQFSD